MSLPRALEKLATTECSRPSSKLTIGNFSNIRLVEKSASLIVEALNSTVKKILRLP
jgi:hypothetical protein